MKLTLFKKKKGSKIKKMISESNGEMEEGEREMIRGVVGLGETFVKTIMIPRTGVVSVSADMDFDDIISLVIKSGHSRIPVYEDTIDNVIGFLYAKDLLPYLAKKSTNKDYKNNGAVKKILRPVHFVPEGKMIDELLSEFRQKKMHIAVVVDEYGGMAGIVCLENILEEIVGDIQDEYDDEEEDIKKISPDSYLCDAWTPIHEINENLDLDLPENESDSIGGFVFNRFGKIPNIKEKILFDGIEFEIEKMDGRQIKKLRIFLSNRNNKSETGPVQQP
ncbi:MAG TPA: HlyC/CorC family transporter [Spirochaetes bacterium]|nr:HlyC/CorC family transporter [Spirochaetota bacterium]